MAFGLLSKCNFAPFSANLQFLSSVVVLLAINFLGFAIHFLMEEKRRIAFSESRVHIQERMQVQRRNNQLVRKTGRKRRRKRKRKRKKIEEEGEEEGDDNKQKEEKEKEAENERRKRRERKRRSKR